MTSSAVDTITETFRAGGKLLICGNGSSAPDTRHIAVELVSRFTIDFDVAGFRSPS